MTTDVRNGHRQAPRRLALGVAAVLVVLVAGCGSKGSGASSTLTVRKAWARTTPASARNGVVYAVVISPVDDELTGASVSPSVAAAVELHESMGSGDGASMANMPGMADDGGGGQMKMVPLDRVPLPARKPVTFEPGGKHMMLTGLAAPLAPGTGFTLTLRFARGGTTDVRVEVRDNPPD